MISKDPKKTASGVLCRAFGGAVPGVKKKSQPAPSLFGSAGDNSNFGQPDVEVQGYANGGEVSAGKLMAASEILEAMTSRDERALAEALQSFFDQAEAEPHEEYESMEIDEIE